MFCFLRLCFETLVASFARTTVSFSRIWHFVNSCAQGASSAPTAKFARLFWLLVRRCWSGWKQALLAVTPDAATSGSRAAARFYPRIQNGNCFYNDFLKDSGNFCGEVLSAVALATSSRTFSRPW